MVPIVCRQTISGKDALSARSVVFDPAPQLLHGRAARLGLQPPFDRAFRRPGLLARLRWRFGGLGDQRGQPAAGVGAVLLLRAEAAGFDDDDAVLGRALAGEPYTSARARAPTGPPRLLASKRSCTAVATLLTFWPPGPDERMKFSTRSSSAMDDRLVGDDDVVRAHVDRDDASRDKEKARRSGPCRPAFRYSAASLDAREPRSAPRRRHGLRTWRNCR